MRANESAPLRRLLRPASIAVVGVSEGRSMGRVALLNLQRFGFSGAVHVVSRSTSNIEGLPCVASVDALPDGLDVALLAIPAAGMHKAVEDCARKGFGAAVVFASGYAETGPDGRERQEALAQVARNSGMLLVGPNCMGLTNYAAGVPLTFESVHPLPNPGGPGIGVVSQSGAMANNMRDAFSSRGLYLTCSIGTGNEALLGVEACLEHLIADPQTGLVCLYVEQIRAPARFLELADLARAARKPLVLLMPGRSVRAQAAAMSHTGAVAGHHATACVMLDRAGVVRVETLDELIDTAAFLVRYSILPPGGVAFVTNSGAVKNLALDTADALGMELPAFTADVALRLKALLPDYAVAENPLDYTTANARDPALMGQLTALLDQDPGVGCVMVSAMAGSPRSQQDKQEQLIPALATLNKPAALIIMGDRLPLGHDLSQAIVDSRVPFFRSNDRAWRAVNHALRYRDALKRGPQRAIQPKSTIDWPSHVGTLAEFRCKALLAGTGLVFPSGELARDVDHAVAIARQLAGPVVLKAQAADLPHKSDAGGVILGVQGEVQLRKAWDQLHVQVAQARPELVLDGVLVEAMGAPGLELAVGGRRDPNWGPILMVGLGGVWIEALNDVSLLPADADRQAIRQALLRLKAAPLLQGARATDAINLGAVIDAVSAVGAVMCGSARVVDMDINPLVARPDGAWALDALVVLGGEQRALS